MHKRNSSSQEDKSFRMISETTWLKQLAAIWIWHLSVEIWTWDELGRWKATSFLSLSPCKLLFGYTWVRKGSNPESKWKGFERIITIHLTCFRYTCNIQLLYSLNNPGRDMGRVEHRIMLNGSLFNGSSDLVNHAVIGNCSDIFWTWCCSSLVLTETIISRVVLRNALFPPDIKKYHFQWTQGNRPYELRERERDGL